MHSALSLILVGIPAAVVLMGFAVLWNAYKRRDAVGAAQLVEAKELGRDIPVSLHPVVDPQACLCSGACVAVCPEDGVLQIVNGTARLVNASACIGHGLCEAACPVQAIKLVFGSSQRGVQIPDLKPGFESSRPGIHIIGELGGMGLIKNAVQQGVEAVGHLAVRLSGPPVRRPKDAVLHDVVIVGAGPAGLAAALACRERNLSFEIVDQNTVGGSIASYPRQKVVMSERVDLPIYGSFSDKSISKEQLLAGFSEALNVANVQVHEKVRVERIDGQDGGFVVHSNAAPLHCRKVILALGRRGTPRMLEVPGEAGAPNVTYNLQDPKQYNDKRVVVVGGGDSAIETAIMLATESSASVGICYRGPAFVRAKRANLERIQQLIASGNIKAYLRSDVIGIAPDMVRLDQGGRRFVLRCDFVIVQVGGQLPDAFLKSLDVNTSMHVGQHAISSPDIALVNRTPPKPPQVVLKSLARSLSFAFVCVSVLAFTALAYLGRHYYPLARAARIQSDLHPLLRPTGPLAQGIGIVATSVMMLNFAYAVRKRVKTFRNFGNLSEWLDLHMLIGVITPLFVAFHAAFQSRNVIATTTSLSLAVVVLTGFFGRFLFALVPTEGDTTLGIDELIARWEALRQAIELESMALRLSGEFTRLNSAFYTPPNYSTSVWRSILTLGFDLVSVQANLWRTRKHFARREVYTQFRDEAFELAKMRLEIGAYEPLRRMMSVWRVFHIILSCLLVVIIGAHIGVSIYLGYLNNFF